MSSMFIECTSRDNKPRNEPANTNAGRPMEGMLLDNLTVTVFIE
ncbi:unnamed protein product [Brugia timori]|uniref:Uncharacterized protein n=1 Tax=Brugia timori TaxID=42155 RepID=A0A0R3QCM2_9BILA|nr:unnamed protein product [Brugia timori]